MNQFFDKKKKKKGLKYTRRQDFDYQSYFINGAIYITSKNLSKKKVIDYNKSDFIIMDKKFIRFE